MNDTIISSEELAKLRASHAECVEALKKCLGIISGEDMNKNGLIEALSSTRQALHNAEAIK